MPTSEGGNDNDQRLVQRLRNFTARHTSHHVPLALVTSGGTAAPLERNCVRYLDNFSTGTRGACAVEEFCRRGYAVIHLKREGSVAPLGRVLGDVLKCGSGGPNFDSLQWLFDCDIGEEEGFEASGFGLQDIDDESENFQTHSNVNNSSDPWMYSSGSSKRGGDQTPSLNPRPRRRGELSLNPRLIDSPSLQFVLRTYKRIKNQGLLLTVDFRTVDEYLHKLQLCCEAVNTCGSLGLVYLAAAVSDFYIPDEKKALHKIQSRDYGIKPQASSSASSLGANDETESTMRVQSDNTLTLILYPVPKTIPSLRREWCRNAFVVSFKLETDLSILRQKSVMAMQRNDVHLVIGNELSTRYERVFILSRGDDGSVDSLKRHGTLSSSRCHGDAADLPEGYHITEVTAAHGLTICGPSASNVDALENTTIEHVVRHHFQYISTTMNGDVAHDVASAAELTVRHTLEAKSLHEKRLGVARKQLQRQRVKARLAEFAWNAAGSVLGMALSYGIARMLHARQNSYNLSQ